MGDIGLYNGLAIAWTHGNLSLLSSYNYKGHVVMHFNRKCFDITEKNVFENYTS